MPRSGLAAATTGTLFACSRSMTLAQLELSAKAPCTNTTVGADVLVVSDMVMAPLSMSSEGEHEHLDARLEELDLEPPVADRRRLADQLVDPLVVGGAVAMLIDVDAVGATRRLTVETHGEPHGGAPNRWTHYEMQIAGVELIRDGTARFIEPRRHGVDLPVARQCPLVAPQFGRRRVRVAPVRNGAARRREGPCAFVAEVGFGRAQVVPVSRRFATAR